MDQLVDALDAAAEGREAADLLRAGEDDRQQRAGVGGEVEEVAQGRPQRIHPRLLADAEDGREDDLQGDRLHPRAQLVGGAGGPAVDLLGGDRRHRLAVALHALAVERRQQQLALAQMGLLVEDEDRVLAEDRAQDLVALAGVEDLRVAGEDLLDQGRVGDHHPVPLTGDPDREHLAEAGTALLQHPLRPARPDRGLQGPRHPRSGRKPAPRSGRRRYRDRCGHRLHSLASTVALLYTVQCDIGPRAPGFRVAWARRWPSSPTSRRASSTGS